MAAFVPSVGKLNSYLLGLYLSLKKVNLQPVMQINIQFDPFTGGVCKSARDFSYYMNTHNIRLTNIKCGVKTEVRSDHAEPQVLVKLSDGHTVVFKSANLSLKEMIDELNKICQTHIERLQEQKAKKK